MLLAFFVFNSPAQEEGGVLVSTGNHQPGYVLFAPLQSKVTYLIDKQGRPVHSWRSQWLPAQSAYLLPDGDLLRTGIDTGNKHFPRSGGWIEKLDAQSRVVWSYIISDQKQRRHHDICPMPNGNILVLVWEKRTARQAIKEGRNPAALEKDLWTEKIIEIKAKGTNSAEIVWEWNVWDHLVQDFDKRKNNYGVIAESPGRFNINFLATKDPDWLHFNSISYNPKSDQIIFNSRNFCEFYVIDHSTTTKEAASHKGGKSGKGGDILYRWGNPRAYNRGTEKDQKFFSQHNAHWIESADNNPGKIMVFNNGLQRPEGEFSSVDILEPPYTSDNNYALDKDKSFKPDTLWRSYTAEDKTSFFSQNISSAQLLNNGNIMICEGVKGKFFEVDQNNKIVWSFVNAFPNISDQGPVSKKSPIFKCVFYEPSYPGLKKILRSRQPEMPER